METGQEECDEKLSEGGFGRGDNDWAVKRLKIFFFLNWGGVQNKKNWLDFRKLALATE